MGRRRFFLKRHAVSVYLDEEEAKKLKKISDRYSISLSTLLRLIVLEWLRNSESVEVKSSEKEAIKRQQ